ncbi:mast cell protease 4-like [Colossoma macropomum]|uniref:mast cell protease 4-like n=1 Tax=Colossoma macropomum TaxID=42526 RepID=UPI001863CF82|nr:mast cell protease 4-like [Colossoma macropomum]
MAPISLLLLAALLPYLSHSASVNVGIINGTEAKPHSRPYMVSIQEYGSHQCGGFLLSEKFVMTAAHCREDKETLTAVLGAHDLSNKQEKGSVRMEVESYYRHPNYSKGTLDNDIMILKLRGRVKMGPNISWIPIPQRNKDVPANMVCSVAGWGQTEAKILLRDPLMETKIRIVGYAQCKKLWGHYLSPVKMCAVHPGGVCMGDSGGPLVCGNTAVGIASFIQECNAPTKPNGFAKISAFLPWIKSVIGKM